MHYQVNHAQVDGMLFLRSLFPDGEADDLNFCLFSTSGVHGTYNLIEEAEEHLRAPSDETCSDVTFLVIHPRTVTLKYGNCEPQNADDIVFLKKLRASSHRAIAQVGMSSTPGAKP